MKKILTLFLTAALVFTMTGCSSSLKEYTPVYGDELVVNPKLEYKTEYEKAISPETRKAISDYLSTMAMFYNSVDPAQEQSTYFTYLAYTVSNNFISQMDVLAGPLVAKLDAGEKLTAEEQLFWDSLTVVNAIPIKISEIDSDAFKAAQEKLPDQTADKGGSSSQAESSSKQDSSSDSASVSGGSSSQAESSSKQDSSSDSATVSGGSDSSSNSTSSSNSEPEIKLTLDGAQWEELFNLYIKAFDLLYTQPFAK
ncbi:MAG: hypothetical protein RR198_02730 [Oscillospiraceae bacterium]